jgi:lysyl-tRNA synthetase class II
LRQTTSVLQRSSDKDAELVNPKLAEYEKRIADLEDENNTQKFLINAYEASIF